MGDIVVSADQPIERGRVKFFDDRDGKHFGFLQVLDGDEQPTGEEIFFHYNDGEWMISDGESSIFSGSIISEIDNARLRAPKNGEILVFKRAPGRKGDKASPWSYVKLRDAIEKRLADQPVVRVIKTTKNDFVRDSSDRVTEEIIWEGKNLLELSSAHPKRDVRNDDTLGYSSIENGYIVTSYRFKALLDGEWIECEDPRVFDCCVPMEIFRRFGPFGYRQTRRCSHGTMVPTVKVMTVSY